MTYNYPITEEGWDKNSKQYEDLWKQAGFREWLLGKELEMVYESYTNYVNKKNPTVLDIGVGAGRIVSLYLNKIGLRSIFGVDYSENMLTLVKNKFGKKVTLEQCDIAKGVPTFKEKFDFISSIRVLKYTSNFDSSIKNVSSILAPGGYFIFTLPNKHSFTYLSATNRKLHTLSLKEVKQVLNRHNLVFVEARGYNRLPEAFYNFKIISKAIVLLESTMSEIFKNHFLAREIFILCKKK